jgi:DNA-binding response OmpR family regulator
MEETMIPCIVVVDDEPSVNRLLQDLLTSRGYDVVDIRRPELVYAIDPSLDPELFLIDLMLPGTNGIELARRLRATRRFAKTPMVALSASRMKLHGAVESRLFDDILAKPFDVRILLDMVQRYSRQNSASGAQRAGRFEREEGN